MAETRHPAETISDATLHGLEDAAYQVTEVAGALRCLGDLARHTYLDETEVLDGVSRSDFGALASVLAGALEARCAQIGGLIECHRAMPGRKSAA